MRGQANHVMTPALYFFASRHSHMKMPVQYVTPQQKHQFFVIFSCKHEREQMLDALLLFIWCHSCFHSKIRLQLVAFPAAASSKKSIFLNQNVCNNTDDCSLCSSHLICLQYMLSNNKQQTECVKCQICYANPIFVLVSQRVLINAINQLLQLIDDYQVGHQSKIK